jgi:protease-4
MKFTALLQLLTLMTVVGCGSPSLLITPVANTNELKEQQVQPGGRWSKDKIAIIELEGMISNSRSAGLLQPGENMVSLLAQQLEAAERDRNVKGIVLRINSPGGTVTGSDTIYELLRRYKQRTGHPIVASAQEVAASGAYYVALVADQIVVQPTSIVGSVGVIFNTFEFSGTMSKLGIRGEAIKSGRFKDLGSPYKPLAADERALMQEIVDEYFARFTALVHEHRPGIPEDVFAKATDGRVVSGQQAVAWGLADRTGMLSDAINLARELSGAHKAKAILYKRPFGYSGSIYASTSDPRPDMNVMKLALPDSVTPLPGGFYYIWDVGRE